MDSFDALFQDAAKRRTMVQDCVNLIDAEVQSKKGLGGAAVKTVFALVKGVKPGIIAEVVDGLLDEFGQALRPHYQAWASETPRTKTLGQYLNARASAVAESLLGVTDRRAEKAANRTLAKGYEKLRPKGKEHVLAAIPGLAALLDRHIPR